MSDHAVCEEVEGIAAVPAPATGDPELRRVIEALPEKQRQAVTLYYLDERPVEEVAEMMGLPANTVKTHLHRARAGLAAALGSTRKARRERAPDAERRPRCADASRVRGRRYGPRFRGPRCRARRRLQVEPAEVLRERADRRRLRAARRLRREAWMNAATVAGAGAAAIALVWRHGPAVARGTAAALEARLGTRAR